MKESEIQLKATWLPTQMLAFTGRHLRICLIIIGLFLLVDYTISPFCRRPPLQEYFTSHSALPTTGQTSSNPLRVKWGDDSVPETEVLLHKIPGEYSILGHYGKFAQLIHFQAGLCSKISTHSQTRYISSQAVQKRYPRSGS